MGKKVRKKNKIGRNDRCPCGSGKKYKKCCLKKEMINQMKPDIHSQNLNDQKNSSNKKIRDNPSFKKMDKTLEGANALKTFVDLGLLDGFQALGVNMNDEDKKEISENLSKMVGMKEEFELLANIHDRFNEHFLDLGWIAHESINFTAMKKAVELADQGLLEEAESVLIDAYHENLEINIQMIKWIEEFKPRNHLIELAYDDYLAERYHSCILLLFTIIDGVVADTKEIDGNKGFFAEGEEIYAWDSIAAHQTGLTKLRKLLYQTRGKTTTDEIDIPYRNGIMHGRDLGYANKKVAIKLWATVFALKDGIVEIKKGKQPEEPEQFDLIKTAELIKENEIRKKVLDEWKPRELKRGVDFPPSGDPSDYQDESPEKTLIEFFNSWKTNNFGKMIEVLNFRFLEGDTPGKIIFELKNTVFKDKKIKSYSVCSIDDDSPMVTDIKVNLTILKDNNEVSKDITFRMVYERDDGEMDLCGMNNGSWKIYIGIYDIENL
jgi:hypothetical protein